MRRTGAAVVAALAALAAMAIVLALLGHPPARTMAILFQGAAGSSFAISESLLKSIPLLFTALAVVVAFRAGVWNIGGEGQFIVGGIAALAVGGMIEGGAVASILSLMAGIAGGAAWAWIAVLLRNLRQAPEVLTTILLNFVAVHLMGWLINGPLQEEGRRYPQSDPLPPESLLPAAGSTRLHLGIVLAIGAAIAVHLFLFHSAAGLRLRATGLNVLAARWSGVRTRAEITRAMLLSGALAGCGGAVELLGVTGRLYERFASGAGFGGIAVALLAQLHPLGAIPTAVFFGALSTGAGALQRSAGVSAALATLGQGIAVLVLLTLASRMKKEAGGGTAIFFRRLFRRTLRDSESAS
ncbi:MAG TPA: ABC transporter permease [Thermoanaerobaculia bacterium]|nr:ABC transporter permease [Thermoanaerobaculia bacterium]